MKKVFIASDHAGFAMKKNLVEYLQNNLMKNLEFCDIELHDLGPDNDQSCDYPNKAKLVTSAMLKESDKENTFGILICGSGIGMSMAANRERGIRAALATCEFHAKAARQHNNANILCLGERVTGQGLAQNLLKTFLSTEFEGGRHLNRVELFD